MKNNKYQVLSLALVIMVICSLTLGYAVLTQTLNINFGATVQSGQTTWNIYFESNGKSPIKVGNAEVGKIDLQKTTITLTDIILKTKGDSVTYSVNVVNNGEVNAKIDVININTPTITGGTAEEQQALLNGFETVLKYADGTFVNVEDTLDAKETKEMLLTISINNNAAIPSSDITISNLGCTITYVEGSGSNNAIAGGSLINEYGFYYNRKYTGTLAGTEMSYILYEDRSVDVFQNGVLVQFGPAGTMTYEKGKTYLGQDVCTFSDDGKQALYMGASFILDETPIMLEMNEYGFYFGEKYTTYGDDGKLYGMVLYKDGSANGYLNGELMTTFPSGTATYEQGKAVNNGEVMVEFTADGKACEFDGQVFILDKQKNSVVFEEFVLTYENYSQAGIVREGFVTIPREFIYEGVGYQIVEIGAGTFAVKEEEGSGIGTPITSVTIPSSVRTIGMMAFAYCTNLTGSLKIPDSVEVVDELAFTGTSIEQLYIGKGLKTIGEFAFSSDALKFITVDENNTSYAAENNVLFNKNKSMLILYAAAQSGSTYTVPGSVKTITKTGFRDCKNLTSVVLPAGLTTIENSAFQGSLQLSSVNIPSTVTSIGNWTFLDTQLSGSLVIPNGVSIIGESTFNGTKISSLTLGSGVKEIGNMAFRQCANLTSLVIPNNVEIIKMSAFEECTGLVNVDLGDGLQIIEYSAFEGNTNLVSVILSDSITEIQSYAFKNCSKLESVTYKGVTYTNADDLENALKNNNVDVMLTVFEGTKLSS